jgi:hypothetical protein
MPTVKVPLANSVYTNADGAELKDRDYELINAYVNELGYTVKRPGLKLALDLGEGANNPVSGLFWWPHKQCGLAVCNNKIFKLTYVAETLLATNITTNALNGSGRPTFAIGNDGNVATPTIYGVIANGGQMIYSSGTGTTVSNFATITDADAPTTVSHVDGIDSYIVATTGKNTFQHSDLTAPITWSALSFASAMRNPDNVRSLKVHRREIVLFGDVTTERWENDGSSPFAPTGTGYGDIGILAAHSVAKSENALMWLGSEKRFVTLSDGYVRTVYSSYDKQISQIKDVTDCFAYTVNMEGRPFILFNFISGNKSYVYNLLQDNWMQWSYWETTSMRDDRFIGDSYMYSPSWGISLIGSRFDSKIYYINNSYKDDDGRVIRVKKTTGHLDYGTTLRKKSEELRIRMTRGQGGLNVDEPVMLIRWKDDNKDWSNYHEITLGYEGDYEIVKTIKPKGVYRTRQYEFLVTDSVGVTFGDAEEDIRILR